MNSQLIILTGKTASGKDTIKSALLSKYPNLKKIITSTSRNPRVGEKNSDYHFLSRHHFEEKINSGDFAEYVEYGGNLYGTEKKELEQAINEDVLWKIDPSRAGEAREFIKRVFPPEIALKLVKKILVIYVNASDEVILQRLQQRGLPEDEIQKRMEDDKIIWQKYQKSSDYIVENIPGQLDQTIEEVCKIVENSK